MSKQKKIDPLDIHTVKIRESGLYYGDTIMVEVYSQGGSLSGLKTILDDNSIAYFPGVKTEFKTNGAAGRLEVSFPSSSAGRMDLELAAKLAEAADKVLKKHPEYEIINSFAAAVDNARRETIIAPAKTTVPAR